MKSATEAPVLDVLEAIARRRSVRSFEPDPVPADILLTLLDAAHQAPSSYNLQPWEFVVVTDPDVRRQLATAVTPGNVPVVESAGATFVCLGSMRQQDRLADRIEQQITPGTPSERAERIRLTAARMREDQPLRHDHVRTNTFIGIAHLVLAAQKFGLGALWMGGFREDAVKAALEIPADYTVAALVAVGWPGDGQAPKPRARRPLEEIYWFNRYGGLKEA